MPNGCCNPKEPDRKVGRMLIPDEAAHDSEITHNDGLPGVRHRCLECICVIPLIPKVSAGPSSRPEGGGSDPKSQPTVPNKFVKILVFNEHLKQSVFLARQLS